MLFKGIGRVVSFILEKCDVAGFDAQQACCFPAPNELFESMPCHMDLTYHIKNRPVFRGDPLSLIGNKTPQRDDTFRTV
jgi:hypothetical protein